MTGASSRPYRPSGPGRAVGNAARRLIAAAVRSLLARLVLLLALLGAVLFLIGQLVPGAAERLRDADPAWLMVAIGLEVIACLGYVVLFDAVFARSPHRLGFGRSALIALAELAGFVLAPAGIAGPAARVWMLRQGGMPWRAIGSRSVAHGVVFNAPYVAAALALGLTAALHLSSGRAPLVVALTPIALVSAAIVAGLSISAASRMRWLRSPSRRRKGVLAVLETVPDGVRQLPHFLRHPAGLVGALGYWAGDCAVLWAAFQASGGSPTVDVLVLAYMLGQLGNALPLPGGIGGVEPLMLGIFAASGVDTAHAAAAIICYRAISLGLQSVAGTIAVTLWGGHPGSLAGRSGRRKRPFLARVHSRVDEAA
jgi:uncharacterized protein (TIRG00374 family)